MRPSLMTSALVVCCGLVGGGTARRTDPRTDSRPLGAIPESENMNGYQFVPKSPIEEERKMGTVYGRPGSSQVLQSMPDGTDGNIEHVQGAPSLKRTMTNADLGPQPEVSVRGDRQTSQGAAVSERGSQLTSIGVGSGRPESIKKETPTSFGIRRSSINLPSSYLQTSDDHFIPPYVPENGILHAGTPGSGLQEREQGDQPILPVTGVISRKGDPVSPIATDSSWVKKVKPQQTASAALHLSSLRGVYPKWASAAGAPPIQIDPPRGNAISGPESTIRDQNLAGTGLPQKTTVHTATTTRK